MLDFDVEKGWIKVGFNPKPEFLNMSGHVQGGFISAMLDDTLGPAIVVKTKGEVVVPTIDLHTHFLSPVHLGDVICEAHVTKLGRSIAFTEGTLYNSKGKACARATASSMLVPIQQN